MFQPPKNDILNIVCGSCVESIRNGSDSGRKAIKFEMPLLQWYGSKPITNANDCYLSVQLPILHRKHLPDPVIAYYNEVEMLDRWNCQESSEMKFAESRSQEEFNILVHEFKWLKATAEILALRRTLCSYKIFPDTKKGNSS